MNFGSRRILYKMQILKRSRYIREFIANTGQKPNRAHIKKRSLYLYYSRKNFIFFTERQSCYGIFPDKTAYLGSGDFV